MFKDMDKYSKHTTICDGVSLVDVDGADHFALLHHSIDARSQWLVGLSRGPEIKLQENSLGFQQVLFQFTVRTMNCVEFNIQIRLNFLE